MIGRQHGRRDGKGAPKAALRLDQIARDFAHDAEVVQRVGEVGMKRAEAGFLCDGSLAQQRFG
jgi:hypothetical protein